MPTLHLLYLLSAGVGRTGTYIALDALFQIGKRTGKVNVAEFVTKMRQNRVSMIQTYVSCRLLNSIITSKKGQKLVVLYHIL